MYSFTLNKKAYTIPADVSELTLGQFIDISNLQPDDELGLLTALMKESPVINVTDSKEAKQVDRELNNVYALIELFKERLHHCLNSGELLHPPKRIDMLGLDIEIKKNFVRSLPYWGFVHTRQVIQKNIKSGKNEQFNATQDIAGILAHNLYCLATKSPYNEKSAEEFIEVVRECSFVQAMQLGNFFLIQQKRLWTSRRKRWIMNLNLWRLRLVSMFLTNTARPIRSKLYQEGIFYDGKK